MTTGVFLAIFLPVAFFCTILLLYYLRNADKTLGRIEKVLEPVSQLMKWIHEKGIERVFPLHPEAKSNPNPLTPEEQSRRDLLLEKGSMTGLYPSEVEELQAFLRREAEADLEKGIIGILAFIGALAVIKAIGDYLQRPK